MDNPNNNLNQPVQPVNPIPVANQAPVATPVVPETLTPKGGFLGQIKEAFNKIRANKKLFRLLVALFAIILLIIIVGSIYSLVRNSRKSKAVTVSPTPVPTAEIMLTEESKKSKSKLKELKDRIQNLDIEQRHLTPPTIDFNISF